MAIVNLFSKRQKILRGEIPDIYSYDDIPKSLRVQIIHIIKDAIGKINDDNFIPDNPSSAYELIHKTLCREYGVFVLDNAHQTNQENVFNFFLKTKNYEQAIDIIELSFRYIQKIILPDLNKYKRNTIIFIKPENAILELNSRLKEHAVGYQFESGEIIKVDSTYAHTEIVKPTLNLLSNKKFSGANQEFLRSHEHYRHGRNKECLSECFKAFESTLKIICKEKNWPFKQTDTSKKLIKICFDNNLVPSFTQNQFTSLQNLLESGIPTIRNKLGGHGQGQVPQGVDDEMTRYALNLTGSNIIFLAEISGIK
jgi:hypothetical protein